mgnify:FL=1
MVFFVFSSFRVFVTKEFSRPPSSLSDRVSIISMFNMTTPKELVKDFFRPSTAIQIFISGFTIYRAKWVIQWRFALSEPLRAHDISA